MQLPSPASGPRNFARSGAIPDAESPAADADTSVAAPKLKGKRAKSEIHLLHCDIIKDEFWVARPELLAA
jgi:hypothetical protein